MKSYYGNYLGIVVQNNDPEKRGRVKVFVPHISMHIYENWLGTGTDKKFKFPGDNIDSDLNTILEPLKEKLPWADCATPLVGAGGAGRYNAFNKDASISDSNRLATFAPNTSGSTDDLRLNNDSIGESPGRKYEVQQVKLHDAFTDTEAGSLDAPNRINKYSYHYTPNTYSNKTKGSYSIPNVGAHLWLFFREGDPNKPVYFAYCTNQEDWRGIYDTDDGDGIDYPGTYENINKEETYPNSTYDVNTETYRNKFVFNQKGGAIEVVNTDNRELLKMTHYSGSFKEFNNHANIELATENDQRLILGDSFQTIKGYGNSYIGRDLDDIVKGNVHRKIGKLTHDLHEQWRDVVGEIAAIKQLFEIKRTKYGDDGDYYYRQSLLQRQFPPLANAECPVCARYGTGANLSWEPDKYEPVNNSFNRVTRHEFNASGKFRGSINYGSIAQPQKKVHGTSGNIFGEICPVCRGTGDSPSTMHGNWIEEPLKEETVFTEFVTDKFKELIDIEKQLGEGGSEIINIAKHKVETIGLAMNDFGSIRVDPLGKMNRDKLIIMPEGVLNSQAPSPLIEYVHVDDLPGGSYTLNVCNRYNVQVGAGGVSMKTYGPVDISGTITNIAGEQVNVTSQSEVNVDGGERLTLVADILTIRQRNRGQVLVDSNLGVSQNVIIGGGLHVEGELSCNHITAPVEIQKTEPSKVFGKLKAGLKMYNVKINQPATLQGVINISGVGNGTAKFVVGDGSIFPELKLQGHSNDDHVECYDHYHCFKNVPLNLEDSNEDVRRSADDINKDERLPAKPVKKV
jgi:hypothetical protein